MAAGYNCSAPRSASLHHLFSRTVDAHLLQLLCVTHCHTCAAVLSCQQCTQLVLLQTAAVLSFLWTDSAHILMMMLLLLPAAGLAELQALVHAGHCNCVLAYCPGVDAQLCIDVRLISWHSLGLSTDWLGVAQVLYS